jgi:hypothetical protein
MHVDMLANNLVVCRMACRNSLCLRVALVAGKCISCESCLS